MDMNKEILQELRLLRQTLESNQGDMCHSGEAIRILCLSNVRDLKKLNDMGVLPRYIRGGTYVYKKAECYLLNEKLNTGDVSLPARKNNLKTNKAA